MQTQTSNTLHNAIMEAGSKHRLPMLAPGWIDKEVPIYKGSPITRTKKFQETYKNVSQDIHDQLNAEAKAVQIILTGIDNDIYSTVVACPNSCEMWKAIERLKHESYYSRFYKMMNELIRNQCNVTNHQVNVQFLLQLQPEWQRFVTLAKQSQELKTVSYHKLYDILKQLQNEVNEIRTKRIARVANPHALDKEIDKLMALISLSFKKIYKPTNNNLQTSSNTSRANQDNSPRINKSVGYDHQRIGNVAGARETVGSIVQSIYVPDTYPIRQDAHNVIIDSLDMSYDREEIDQNDDDNDLANEHKELDKVIALENKVKVLDNIVYKTGQSVQTMNMLNNKCRTSFAKPEFLKKAQRANPHLYDIGCYNDNLSLMLAPESDDVIRLEK
nr:hypothetical protein [Tanacetum cinerariifolium]